MLLAELSRCRPSHDRRSVFAFRFAFASLKLRRTRFVQGLRAAAPRVAPWRSVVRAVGLEPTRRCHRGILSPLRLPVPPRPPCSGSGRYLARLSGEGKWDKSGQNGCAFKDLAESLRRTARKALTTGTQAIASIPSRATALGNLNRVGLPRSDVRFAAFWRLLAPCSTRAQQCRAAGAWACADRLRRDDGHRKSRLRRPCQIQSLRLQAARDRTQEASPTGRPNCRD